MAECFVLLAPEVSTGASTFCQQRNRRDGISTSWEVWWSDEVWDISGPAWCLSGVALASLLRIVRASFEIPPLSTSEDQWNQCYLHHSSPFFTCFQPNFPAQKTCLLRLAAVQLRVMASEFGWDKAGDIKVGHALCVELVHGVSPQARCIFYMLVVRLEIAAAQCVWQFWSMLYLRPQKSCRNSPSTSTWLEVIVIAR